ncbi:MAG: M23 family metallopeptidase [Candidatus Sericytochromatia bacterium]
MARLHPLYLILGPLLIALSSGAAASASRASTTAPLAPPPQAPRLEFDEEAGSFNLPVVPTPLSPRQRSQPIPAPQTKPARPAQPTAQPALLAPAMPPLPRNWQWPVQGTLSNPFGNSYRYYGVYRSGHTGVDIAAARGSLIKAPAAGRVVKVWRRPNQRYGEYVVLQHGPALFSLYGHLQQVRVRPGQPVKAGQALAAVGITGAAGYAHLHFEVLNRLPRADGAWGYLSICAGTRPQGHGFINQPAYTIHSIRRPQGSRCLDRTLGEKITYYNPELFWTASGPLVARQIAPPANEENRPQHAARRR